MSVETRDDHSGRGRSLRVTIVSKACVVGTYQKKLEEIAKYGQIDLTAVVPPFWRENGRRQTLEEAHTRGYHLVIAPLVLNGHFHTHFYPTLPSILRESKPDLCHIDEEPYNLATYLGVRNAVRVGSKALFFSWQNLLRDYPFPFNLMEQHVYRQVCGALAGSRSAERVLREKGYRGPVRVIPQFGVDPQIFCPPSDRSGHGPFTIGYAGRLVPEKGLCVLIDALSGLSGDWRMLFYGDGPLLGELRARAQRSRLEDRICFRRHIPSTEMPEKLGGLDVLVLPSLTQRNWKEQFGRILIEAMACGVPVIGSGSGEIPHVVGNAGIIVPEGNAAALRDALATLRDDTALRTRLSHEGRSRVLAHYTQAHVAEETVAFYQEILDA